MRLRDWRVRSRVILHWSMMVVMFVMPLAGLSGIPLSAMQHHKQPHGPSITVLRTQINTYNITYLTLSSNALSVLSIYKPPQARNELRRATESFNDMISQSHRSIRPNKVERPLSIHCDTSILNTHIRARSVFAHICVSSESRLAQIYCNSVPRPWLTSLQSPSGTQG